MRTFDTTVLPRTQKTAIRWKRVLLAGLLSEIAVIAAISVVVLAYRFVIAPGRTTVEYNEFAQNAGYYAAAPFAAVATFLLAFWAVRKFESAFVANGLLVGTVATLLTMGFIIGARPADRWVYIVSFILRIAAGYCAGVAARRIKERS